MGLRNMRYRIIDTRTGEVCGLFLSFKSASKYADKLEPGGKYVMRIE